MLVRRLTPDDAAAFKALRVEATQESPASFYPSHEEELAKPISEFSNMLSINSINIVLGAFDAEDLVGIAGLRREPFRKIYHKATLWGVYCSPRVRNQGIAKRLVKEIIAIAYNIPELTLVKLAVHTENVVAKKLYESFGFTSYGIEPNSMMVDGCCYDENLMVLNIEK